MYLQNGDVLLFEIDSLPDFVKTITGNTLHMGLNHTHEIAGDFELFSDDKDIYLKAGEGCRLTHQEHKEISVPAGVYKKSIVKEYDHFKEEARSVID